MRFSLGLVTLFLPVLVNALFLPRSPLFMPKKPTHINVQVAPEGHLVYKPADFTATNGTTVTFHFPKNSTFYSVTQGYFAKPCAYLEAIRGKPAGFDSGLESGKKFTLKITDDREPIFFFSKAPFHCSLGMVGAINAPPGAYASYLAHAKALGLSEPVISNVGTASSSPKSTASESSSPKSVPPSLSKSAASSPSSSVVSKSTSSSYNPNDTYRPSTTSISLSTTSDTSRSVTLLPTSRPFPPRLP